MRRSRGAATLTRLSLLLLVEVAEPAKAQTENAIYTFTGCSMVAIPCSQLAGCGAIFELQISTRKEIILHDFGVGEANPCATGATDGCYPVGLLFANGTLYGVTVWGHGSGRSTKLRPDLNVTAI